MLSLSKLALAVPIDKGEASFVAEASPGFLEIQGTGSTVSGEVDLSDQGMLSGKFIADLTTIKTGMKLRDSHMKDKYLEVEKYPKAELKLEPVLVKGEQDFTGVLTLHGVSKKIRGTMTFHGRDVKAQFQIKTSDFKIEQASYKVVTVGDEVSVTVKFSY